jgi:hypothetical protein
MLQFEALSAHKCQSSDRNHARRGTRCVEGGLGPRLLEKSVVPVKARRDVRMKCQNIKTQGDFLFYKKRHRDRRDAEAGRIEQTGPAAPFSELCWPVQVLYLLYYYDRELASSSGSLEQSGIR